MSGIRLHHPTLNSCTLVVELAETYHNRKPRWCVGCDKEHDRKSIHIRLDSTGHVFVSPEVLESLRPVFLAGMEVVNEVEKPPTQLLGAVDQPTVHVVENKLDTAKNAEPFYKPGITKYEARDKMLKPATLQVISWLKKNIKDTTDIDMKE